MNGSGIFTRRQDFSSFNSLPRHKLNSYHIKVRKAKFSLAFFLLLFPFPPYCSKMKEIYVLDLLLKFLQKQFHTDCFVITTSLWKLSALVLLFVLINELWSTPGTEQSTRGIWNPKRQISSLFLAPLQIITLFHFSSAQRIKHPWHSRSRASLGVVVKKT